MINYAGDYDFCSNHIKCFADHEQAHVFNVQPFSEESPVRVLAFSLREAEAIVEEYFRKKPASQTTPIPRELDREETGDTL